MNKIVNLTPYSSDTHKVILSKESPISYQLLLVNMENGHSTAVDLSLIDLKWMNNELNYYIKEEINDKAPD